MDDLRIIEGKKRKGNYPRKWRAKSRKPIIPKKRASKAPSRSKLIKEADRLCSLKVRQSSASQEGIVQCYTCSYKNHWKKMQCGHYISRFFKYTRWDFDNMRPQCFVCNMRLGGCSHIFREKLVIELGETRVKEMEVLAKVIFKEPDEWIQQIIDDLTSTKEAL